MNKKDTTYFNIHACINAKIPRKGPTTKLCFVLYNYASVYRISSADSRIGIWIQTGQKRGLQCSVEKKKPHLANTKKKINKRERAKALI